MSLAVVLPNILLLIAAGIAERQMPYRHDWRKGRATCAPTSPARHYLFAVLDPLLKWGLPVAVLGLAGTGVQAAGAALFPVEWPFFAQVLLAALLVEFTSYWSHRLHHHVPALWRLHALHHGSERMYR